MNCNKGAHTVICAELGRFAPPSFWKTVKSCLQVQCIILKFFPYQIFESAEYNNNTINRLFPE